MVGRKPLCVAMALLADTHHPLDSVGARDVEGESEGRNRSARKHISKYFGAEYCLI
jgi:hypothetical protein